MILDSTTKSQIIPHTLYKWKKGKGGSFFEIKHKSNFSSSNTQALTDLGHTAKQIGVINDPLGQTHSLASSGHWFVLLDFEKWGRTDDMRENNDPYRPWLWVGRVDQNKGTMSNK